MDACMHVVSHVTTYDSHILIDSCRWRLTYPENYVDRWCHICKYIYICIKQYHRTLMCIYIVIHNTIYNDITTYKPLNLYIYIPSPRISSRPVPQETRRRGRGQLLHEKSQGRLKGDQLPNHRIFHGIFHRENPSHRIFHRILHRENPNQRILF